MTPRNEEIWKRLKAILPGIGTEKLPAEMDRFAKELTGSEKSYPDLKLILFEVYLVRGDAGKLLGNATLKEIKHGEEGYYQSDIEWLIEALEKPTDVEALECLRSLELSS